MIVKYNFVQFCSILQFLTFAFALFKFLATFWFLSNLKSFRLIMQKQFWKTKSQYRNWLFMFLLAQFSPKLEFLFSTTIFFFCPCMTKLVIMIFQDIPLPPVYLSWGLHYRTLGILNVLKIDRLQNKAMFVLLSVIFTGLDKDSSFLRNLYIMDL